MAVSIPKSEFIKEHKNLLKVLTKGTPAQRRKEAKEQAGELKKMVGGVFGPKTNLLDALTSKVASDAAAKLAQSQLEGTERLNWGGKEWYLRPYDAKTPPGFWLETDLTPTAVKQYGLVWHVLGEFPDGSFREYWASPKQKGLDGIDPTEERARNELWNAWGPVLQEMVDAQVVIPTTMERLRSQRVWFEQDKELRKAQADAEQKNKEAAMSYVADAQKRVDAFTAKYNITPQAVANANIPEGTAPPDLQNILTLRGYSVGEFWEDYETARTSLEYIQEVMDYWTARTKGGAKPPEERRVFPEQFSKPLRKLMDEVSFGPPDVMGSAGDHKVMYSADYDLLEFVVLHGKATVKAFQKKIASLSSKYCVTDIKCGEVSEWNLLQTKKYDPAKEREHLRRLWKEKVITDSERKMGEAILKDKLSTADRVAARKKLRFGILRWTPREVAEGVKMTRLDKPIRLEDAMKSKGITKVDVLAWVKEKYVEVSNIILWTNRSSKPYAHIPEVLTALKEEVAYYLHDGNYFKATKRMLSIAKNRKETAQQEALLSILNSQLGHISTVISDLRVLAEFPKCVSDEKKRLELDNLRDDMAKLYYPEFAKAKDPSKLLPALEVKLQEEAKKKLEQAGFLPVKGLYKAEKE